MRLPRIATLLPTLLMLLASAGGAHAQSSPFRGTWVRDAAAGDDMKVVIDQSLPKIKSTLGRLFTGVARKRLTEVNRPYPWMQIVPTGNSVTVETPFYKLTTPRNGTLEDWEREKGDLVDVNTQMQDRRMQHTFVAEDGRRVNVYTLSPDGRTLTMNVNVSSEQLSSPITYRLVYRRQG